MRKKKEKKKDGPRQQSRCAFLLDCSPACAPINAYKYIIVVSWLGGLSAFFGVAVVGGEGLEGQLWGLGSPVALCVDPPPYIISIHRTRYLMVFIG